MRKTSVAVWMLCMISTGIAAEVPAPPTQAAQSGWVKISVPGHNLSVAVNVPKDWKARKDKSGKPIIYKPGETSAAMVAEWSFDIRSGLRGRPIDQIMNGFASAMNKTDGVKDIKKELVDMGNGKQAGSVSYSRTVGEQTVFSREFFYLINDDLLFIGDEDTFTQGMFVTELHAMTLSATLISDPPATAAK